MQKNMQRIFHPLQSRDMQRVFRLGTFPQHPHPNPSQSYPNGSPNHQQPKALAETWRHGNSVWLWLKQTVAATRDLNWIWLKPSVEMFITLLFETKARSDIVLRGFGCTNFHAEICVLMMFGIMVLSIALVLRYRVSPYWDPAKRLANYNRWAVSGKWKESSQ